MNPLSRPHPAQVPTLTEVIEVDEFADLGQLGPQSVPSQTVPQPVPAPAAPQPIPLDSLPVLEGQLAQRVLTDVQRQIDSMLEFRLREALAPVLARHSEAIVRELKDELARTMRDVVARSVAQEVAKLRPR
jgi:hypothetical protein